MKMKSRAFHRLSVIVMTVFVACCSSFASIATEDLSSENKYYLGEAVKTGWDNGYSGKEKIKEGDPHFNWKIGEFFVSGYTSVNKSEGSDPVFLKNVGDKVQLWFHLQQDIDKLNGDENLSVSEDSNGSDEYFSVPKTNFKRGTLIIQKTAYNNAKEDPIVYADYLAAKTTKDADTEVELCEEGDYEVALDYELRKDPRKVFDVSIIPEFSNYRIFFKFSVRNGNCMVYPFDVKTKGELANTSITENGFYLDFANSRYLDINIKKEILNEGATGLAEDVRFNRPAKDGEQYTEEGIYTITASNKYTGQLTVKKIYVGNDDILKAVVTTGLTVSDVVKYQSEGATIEKDGTITLANHKTLGAEESALPTDVAVKKADQSTQDSALMSFVFNNFQWIAIGGAALIIVIVLIIIISIAKKRKKKRIQAEKQETVSMGEERYDAEH